MKKLVLALVFTCICLPAQAMAFKQGMYIAPKISYTYSSADTSTELNDVTVGSSANISDNLIGGALAVGYDYSKKYSVPVRAELEYNIYSPLNDDTSITVGANTTNSSHRIGSQAIFLNAYYDIHTKTKFTPYVGAGLGIGILSYDATSSTTNPLSTTSYDKKTEADFAWNVAVGTAFKFTENFALDVSYRYSHLGEAKTQTRAGVNGQTDTVSTHQAILAARFNF